MFEIFCKYIKLYYLFDFLHIIWKCVLYCPVFSRKTFDLHNAYLMVIKLIYLICIHCRYY